MNRYKIPGVIYDSAICTSVTLGHSTVFPNIVKTVVNHQSKIQPDSEYDLDGSWGSSFYSSQDHLLSTAASLYMLQGIDQHRYGPHYESYNSGIAWLERNHNSLLSQSKKEASMIGFDILYPTLLQGIIKSTDIDIKIDPLLKVRKQKIKSMHSVIYRQKTPHLFYMEGIVEDNSHARQLSKLRSNNNSLSASPSSTSVFLRHRVKSASAQALKYLKKSTRSDGMVAHIEDYYFQDYLFSMYPFVKLGLPFPNNAKKHLKVIVSTISNSGVGISKNSAVPQADMMALMIYIIESLEYSKTSDLTNMLNSNHEKDTYYKNYQDEEKPNIMANLYVYEALKCRDEEKYQPQLEKIKQFIDNKLDNSSFYDFHWHNASQVIQLSNLILALTPDFTKQIEIFLPQLNSLLYQKFNRETLLVTEAGHSLVCFNKLKSLEMDIDEVLYHNLNNFLKASYKKIPEKGLDEATWIGKIVYNPPRIGISHILAALIAYNKDNDGI